MKLTPGRLRRPIALLALLSLLLPWRLVAAEPDADAEALIVHFHASLVEILAQSDGLSYGGRYRLLAPLVRETHDLPYIARLVIGRRWSELEEAQREDFVATFERLSIATYASRFRALGGEGFSVNGSRAQPRGVMLVESVLEKPDGERIRFEYLLHRPQAQWRIINILVDGVSDIALKRAEYTRLWSEGGLPGVLQSIENQIEKHEQSP